MIDFHFLIKTFWLSIRAIPVTLEITVVSLLLAVVPALIIALVRIKKIKVLSQLGAVYVSFIRGTPVVLQILVIYSLIPSLLNVVIQKTGSSFNVFELNPIIYAFIVFALNSTATLSEVFRSALQTVHKGQMEAALSIGLTKFQAFRRILFPQAFNSALPNICNLTVGLIKNTSLAFMMTVKDITAVAKIEAAYGYNYIEAYLDIFVVYLIVCSVVQVLFKFTEKKFEFKGTKKTRASKAEAV